MRILEYDSLSSTNSEISRLIADGKNLCDGDIVVCSEQTAGRGQRGNSWEAEPGKNLTFSIFLKPKNLLAADSFLLSMAVSVGITEALNNLLEPQRVRIKWPNDIYWNDSKLVGILIENSFTGSIVNHSIIGIGVNVNQKIFLSDAPNPISMSRIAGHDFNLKTVLNEIGQTILNYVSKDLTSLTDTYYNMLWRNDGSYLWHEPDGRPFSASIEAVKPSGHLVLKTESADLRTYAFKEVFPVI